jgi:tetratricopeptide (TPR) repeat protein
LEIDDSLAEAHASLGLSYQHAWQWEEAEREYKRAIELNPNYATAYHWYGIWLDYMGRFDEAMAAHRRAQELDPLSQAISQNLVVYHLRSGDFDAALNEARKNKELNPNLGGEHWILAFVRLKQGRHEEAIAEMQKAVERAGSPNLGHVYGVAGRRSEALAIVKELEDRYAKGDVRGAGIAFVYAGLGDKDQAFAWLERDFQERSILLANAMIFQPFLLDTLRDDPRYADMLRRMGLPY